MLGFFSFLEICNIHASGHNAGGIDPGLLSQMGYGTPASADAGDNGYAHAAAAAAAAAAATQAYPSQPAPTFELQQQQPQINLSAAFQSLHVSPQIFFGMHFNYLFAGYRNCT